MGLKLDSLAAAAELLRPGEPGYDEARSVQNGLIDRRPAVVVRCDSERAVVEAVGFARANELEISIKCGGHGDAGTAVTDGGVMIDMSGLNGIDVDPGARVVRAGAGLRWGELTAAAQEHGLAPVSGTNATVGISGLTLGGGVGWLLGKHGLTVDNVLAARVVTADGRVLTASADEHPDLFWALRGGGGNFGVVTEFTYRLHPVGPTVTAGVIAYPIEAAPDALRFYRDFTSRGVSEDLAVWALLMHTPDEPGQPIVAISVTHLGSEEDARRELEPLLAYGTPLMVDVGRVPYMTWLEPTIESFTPGLLNHPKSSFLRELSDDAIDALTDSFAACPSPLSLVLLEHFHGAASRIPVEATAVAYRKVGYNFLAFGVWADPASSAENIAWARGAYEAMRPFFDDRMWVNYVGADDIADPEAAARAYGPNLARLTEVKMAYDPQNLFRLNLNIVPRDA